MNWFMPALVNIRVGSFLTTIGADGTTVWPFDAKKSRNFCRISLEVISCYVLYIRFKSNYKSNYFLRKYETADIPLPTVPLARQGRHPPTQIGESPTGVHKISLWCNKTGHLPREYPFYGRIKGEVYKKTA